MKIAVWYVHNGMRGTELKLFAVCPIGPEVTRHYNLARESIPYGASDWITTSTWSDSTMFSDLTGEL